MEMIYDQPNLSSLANKIESVQHDAALAITDAIRGTSKEKLYQELGFESLKDRRWLRRLCYLYKIVNTKQPAYLYDLIPPFQRSSRNKGCIYEPFCRTMSFKNSFLPYAIKEWNKLDPNIRNAETYASFRKMLLNFIRPKGNNTYKIYDPLGIKLLTRLRLGFSHHSEHKFRQLCWLTESVYFVLCLIVSLQNMIIIIMEKKNRKLVLQHEIYDKMLQYYKV